MRTWSGESRENLILQLKQLTADTNKALQEYQKTQYQGLLLSHIERAKTGVDKLKTAYDDDPNVLANLSVIMEDWDLQIKQFGQG